MIQDSKDYKFDKIRLQTSILTTSYVRQKNNLVPNLTKVKVYVAGASAGNSDQFRAVQTFWARYFAESRADFSLIGTALLISFENGSQPTSSKMKRVAT